MNEGVVSEARSLNRFATTKPSPNRQQTLKQGSEKWIAFRNEQQLRSPSSRQRLNHVCWCFAITTMAFSRDRGHGIPTLSDHPSKKPSRHNNTKDNKSLSS